MRNYLAIPIGFFLLATLPLPSYPQSQANTPQEQEPTASGTQAQQKPPLSDEDLARLYLIRKQYREAQDLFHKLTVQEPKNAVYWNELGISFHNQAELDPAMKCYQKSAKLDPHYADAQNNVGTVYYERKRYSRAVRAYKKAVALKSDYAGFYLNLGYAYFADKKYTEAINSFREALKIDPNAFNAARSRSGTIVQDRTVSSDRAHFYFLLAKSFAEAGDVEHCVLYLKKARDEGYKELEAAKSDPSFAKVIKDPAVLDVLQPDKAADAIQQQ
jgi:tetratricopeptide (TPR) repeat protein